MRSCHYRCPADDPTAYELLWSVKQPQLVAVNYTTPSGAVVTAQRGFWFSSHEQWKALLLPYLALPLVRDVFANCERARSWDAARGGIPGLFASVSDVASGGSIDIPDYISAAGVQVRRGARVRARSGGIKGGPAQDRVPVPWRMARPSPRSRCSAATSSRLTPPSPSSSTTYRRACAGVRAAPRWETRSLSLTPTPSPADRNMLAGPRMQGPHGSTEATAVNGTLISPVTTWDSKVTTVLALAGGVAGLTGAGLAQLPWAGGAGTALDRFNDVVARAYGAAFPVVVGTGEPFATPTAAIPDAAPDWTASCPGM